jgi:hypothetical protein
MLSSQVMSSSSSSSYPDHHAEVSSSFFVSNSDTALAHAAVMPWEQQASAVVAPSSPVPEESANSSSTAAAEERGSEQDMLPADFSPHEHSVVCGRGNKCINAPGSQRLKIIASKFLQEYSHTKCKKSKAVIVADIIDLVRSECPNGGQGAFVRFHQNRWWEADELGARQKVTTVMRDGLHTMYKSSSKSKVAKRRTRKVLLEHRRQESVPSISSDTILKDMFQRTFAPQIFCDQNDLEEGILRESPLEPISLDVPSSNFFHQQHQEKPSTTSSMHKASRSPPSRLQDTMQRRRKLLGHLEEAERIGLESLEMLGPLEPTPTMHVTSTLSFNNNNNYKKSMQLQYGISVATPPAFRSNLFAGWAYASSRSSGFLTGDDNDVATPLPLCAPCFPDDASFDIDNIFD